MKTTIEIPDELYRGVEAKSAAEGRHVREIAVELLREWGGQPAADAATTARGEQQSSSKRWYGYGLRYIRKQTNPDLAALRESIDRGWAASVDGDQDGNHIKDG